MELIEKEGIDVAFIQEPCTVHKRVVGTTKRHRAFTSSVGRYRTATVVTDNRIDALLIEETTDKDMVMVKLMLDKLKFHTATHVLGYYRKIRQRY